jgi:phosphatidylinositol 3-kinase
VPKHERGEVERLEKLTNKFERGLVPHIDWLDRLTFKAVEEIKEAESKRNGSTQLHLAVDLRTFEHPVAFQVWSNPYIFLVNFTF